MLAGQAAYAARASNYTASPHLNSGDMWGAGGCAHCLVSRTCGLVRVLGWKQMLTETSDVAPAGAEGSRGGRSLMLLPRKSLLVSAFRRLCYVHSAKSHPQPSTENWRRQNERHTVKVT